MASNSAKNSLYTAVGFIAGQDLAGTATSQTVIGIQKNQVQAGVNGAGQDQFNLQWNQNAVAYVPTDSKIIGGTTTNNTLKGGLIVSTVTITTDITLSDGYFMIFVDTSAAHNITLPVPVNGREFIIKDIIGTAETNVITLVQHSSEKIEGIAASRVLNTNWGCWKIMSNGTDWFIIN